MITLQNELKYICKILSSTKTIAVVGFSREPYKTSREIADFLVRKNYTVVGVNPNFGNGNSNGIQVFKTLTEIPYDIDIVNVFRRSEDIPEIIDDVLAIKPKVLWLQEGIRNDNAVESVINAGIQTIQDRCIAVYYNLCKSHPHN